MKAMIYNGGFDYEKGLVVSEIDFPTLSGNQVLIKVEASSLNIIDFEKFKRSDKPSLFSKVIRLFQGNKGFAPGGELSGTIVEIGDSVSEFSVGQEIMGSTIGVMPKGAWAEYAVCDKNAIVHKPYNLSHQQAAVLPLSGLAALSGIEKAKIGKNEEVLIYGASGGVGLYALQLAKAKGANVTAVCSTRNIELVKQYGASSVIDYLREDFTKSEKLFDKIISINGYNSVRKYIRLLRPNGVYVAVGNAKQLFHASIYSIFNFLSRRKVYFSSCAMSSNNHQLEEIKRFSENKMISPYIDCIYAIEDVSKAIDYVVNIHAQGKVAISMDFK